METEAERILREYREDISNLSGQDRANFKARHFAAIYGGLGEGVVMKQASPRYYRRSAKINPPIKIPEGDYDIELRKLPNGNYDVDSKLKNYKLLLICF